MKKTQKSGKVRVNHRKKHEKNSYFYSKSEENTIYHQKERTKYIDKLDLLFWR